MLVVPLCARCAREWKLRMWRVGLVTFGSAAAFAFVLLAALTLDSVVFWVLFVLVCGVTPLVAAAVAYRLTTPFRVKSVDASRAIARLWFRSEEYRIRVLRVRTCRLITSSMAAMPIGRESYARAIA